jgi:hypothetical protein
LLPQFIGCREVALRQMPEELQFEVAEVGILLSKCVVWDLLVESGGLRQVVVFAFGGGPGRGFEGTLLDGFGIDDDLGGRRFEGEAFDVHGGDAEGAENEGSNFGIEVAVEEKTNDLGESELDGVGVFERQGEKSEGRAFGLVAAGALIVEVTEGEGAEGGGSALDAVDFDVLAAGDSYGVSWHI